MKKALLFFCFLAFTPSYLFSGNETKNFEQANEAYRNGEFNAATDLYEELLSQGFTSPEVHYNLGNSYFKLGQRGKAILNYERAALHQPHDEDIKHNLQFAREQIPGDNAELPDFFLLAGIKKFRMVAGEGVFGTIALVLWWSGLAFLAFWLLAASRKHRKLGFLMGMVLLVLSLIPFSLAFSRQSFEKNSALAIIMEQSVPLRSAPDEAGSEIQVLYEGAKIAIEDELSSWYKVRLPDGEIGWLEAGVVERI